MVLKMKSFLVNLKALKAIRIVGLWYFFSHVNPNSVWQFEGSKQLSGTILRSRDCIFEPSSQPRRSTYQPYLQFMWRWGSWISVSGLLWVTLVVPGLPYQKSQSSPLPSTSTVERRFFWEHFIVWFGLHSGSWRFWDLPSMLGRW